MAAHVRLLTLFAALVAMALVAAFSTARRNSDERRATEASAPAERPRAGIGPAGDRRPGPAATAPVAVRTNARPTQPAPLLMRVSVRRGRSVIVRRSPGGRPVGRVSATTEFGSRSVLAAAARRGPWLGVASPVRTDGRLTWVHSRSAAVRVAPTRLSIHADLSRRSLELRRGRRVLKRLPVAVGRPGSSTPTGTFSVTDKLSGGRFGPYYGCCVLAMSGTQPNLPRGWTGGNRLAIHGTNAPGGIGKASSAGCLRAADRHLRTLMRRVPLGTVVTVRR